MSATDLDAIGKKIIRVLQSDGKILMSDLADKVGLSASPTARRVRLLEDAGIIKGYTAVIDQDAVGLPISAFVSIRLERQVEQNLERFAAAVSAWPEVVDCYLMTGQRDYLMRIVSRDLQAYDHFLTTKLARLEGIASIETSLALRQVKRSEVLPIG